MNVRILGLALALALVLTSCGSQETPEQPDKPTPAPTRLAVPAFDADAAFDHIAKQVSYGPRVPGTDAHAATGAWLVETLTATGARVYEQDFIATTYDGKKLPSKNIIAAINPAATQRVLLCAHWDTRHIADYDPDASRQDEPILGADDGGSGVGVLLEVARLLMADSTFTMGVDIVLFDAEDHGAPSSYNGAYDSWCLGSQHWSKNPHVPGYRANFGILLDMVGSKSPRFTKEGTSMRYAPDVMNKVWDVAASMGYGAFFDPTETSPITDDHLYVNANLGIPTIDIINRDLGTPTNFGAHWHTHNDNLDIIGKGTLKAVGQVVLEVVYRAQAGRF